MSDNKILKFKMNKLFLIIISIIFTSLTSIMSNRIFLENEMSETGPKGK